jgi:hypothetical protein
LEKAKNLIENAVKVKLNESIDATEAKYVTIIYTRKNNFSYITMVKSLASCLLDNEWDRSDALESVNFCGGSKPHYIYEDFDKEGGPHFAFDESAMKTGIPCNTLSISTGGQVHTVKTSISNEKFYLYSAIYKSNLKYDFTPKTHWSISPEIIRNIAGSIDLETEYKNYLNNYWDDNYYNFSKHLRLVFIKSVLLQYEEHSLSEKGATLAINAVTEREESVEIKFIGLYRPLPFTLLAQILGPFPFINLFVLNWVSNIKTDVYSFDIFYIVNKTDGHTLLYLNGNSSPIHEFTNTQLMFLWFIKQCRNETKRNNLLAHFSFTESEDVTKLLEHLSEKEIDKDFLFDKEVPKKSSLFDVVTFNVMVESKENFPKMIVSNRDKIKQKYMNWIDFASLLILPFSLIFPEVLIFDALYTGMSLAEIGIAIDDLRHGKAVGRSRLLFGSLNALPLYNVLLKTRYALKDLHIKIEGYLSEEEKFILQSDKKVNKEVIFRKEGEDAWDLPEKEGNPTTDMDSRLESSLELPTSGKQQPHSKVDFAGDFKEESETSETKYEIKTAEPELDNGKLSKLENMKLLGGAEDEIPPLKVTKYNLVPLNGIKVKNEVNSIVDSSKESLLSHELKPSDKYFIENSKKEIKTVYYDPNGNCWRYKFKQGTSGSLALTINEEWEELSPELTVVIPHKSFEESFPLLPTDWREKVSFVYESDPEGPTKQINGLIFKDGQYTVLINGEEKTVLYNEHNGCWYLEGGMNRLAFTTDKRWVELQETAFYLKPKNTFITHEDFYRFLPQITLDSNVREVPIILNFVITGEIPEKFFSLLSVYQKAFENSVIESDRIVIYTYGKEATINFFLKAENSISFLKIIDYEKMEDIPEFVQSIEPYLEPGQDDLHSLLIRLKLSQTNPGIFLTLDHEIPINTFNSKLMVDEAGVLLPTPVYNEKLSQYIYPSKFFTSLGQEGKTALLLNSFLDNLKLAKSSGTVVDSHDSIFTKSVIHTFDNYNEYLEYYKSIKDVSGELYHLRFSDIKFFNEIDQHFEQLTRLLTKYNNEWCTALRKHSNPSVALFNDPEKVFLMQYHNIEIINVNGEARLMYSTDSDVRELYSYNRFDGKILEPEKTNQPVHLNEAMGIEVLEEKAISPPSEEFVNYHLSRPILVPMDGVATKDVVLFPEEKMLRESRDLFKVLYDTDLQSWALYYSFQPGGKLRLYKPVFFDNGNWRVLKKNMKRIPPKTLSTNSALIVLPCIPKVPRYTVRIPDLINLFVYDLSFEGFIDAYQQLPNLIIVHYDISDALMLNFNRIKLQRSKYFWNDVRKDPNFDIFFRESELGAFYEAARLNNFPEVAYNIMKYQIIKEKGGIFGHFSKVLVRGLERFYTAGVRDILLSPPTKKLYGNSVKYFFSNELIGSHPNNPFFSVLNKEITIALKNNNEYFGDILKGKRPGKDLFPTSEIVGEYAFQRVVIENYPEIKALLNYLDEQKHDFLHYREYEETKNYFFPLYLKP